MFLVTSNLPINQAYCQKPPLTTRSKFLLWGEPTRDVKQRPRASDEFRTLHIRHQTAYSKT
jgi:hypothetical protein